MAYRRCISIRATLIARRYHPCLSYIPHDEDDRRQISVDKSQTQRNIHQFLQHRSFGSSFNNNTSTGFAFINTDKRHSHLSFPPSSFCHYMSTTSDGSVKNELMSDFTDIFTDTAIQVSATTAPVMNEVVVAASDSAFPVAALQYVIDYVHTFTGFNWWSSIVVTTLLIRGFTLPLIISQLKATTKLAHMKPRLEAIKNEIDNKAMDPMAVADGQKRMKSLFKEYGVSPFTPMKGLFIQAPIFISFFLAISNMAEKVPSFKTGGAFWFLDLTTPDSLWILPVLAGSTFLINVELNMQEGMEGNAMAGTMKNVSRALAVLTVPFTHSFPKFHKNKMVNKEESRVNLVLLLLIDYAGFKHLCAIFCYWITSNLFSLSYGLVLKAPGVKKFLGIPDMPKLPPSAAGSQNSFDLFSAVKKAIAVSKSQNPGPARVEVPKPAERKTSSATVLNQKVKALEKKVKGKKKKNRK